MYLSASQIQLLRWFISIFNPKHAPHKCENMQLAKTMYGYSECYQINYLSRTRQGLRVTSATESAAEKEERRTGFRHGFKYDYVPTGIYGCRMTHCLIQCHCASVTEQSSAVWQGFHLKSSFLNSYCSDSSYWQRKSMVFIPGKVACRIKPI